MHHDDGVDFDGFSVEECGSVAPLADRFDGGAREIGVDLAVLDAQREWLAVHTDDSMKNDRSVFGDRSHLQSERFREVATGVERDLRYAIGFEAGLQNLQFVISGG